MSDVPPESAAPAQLPVLRREAMLPSERSRGLGTVAVVCTMAGVASGLALATTLMAMQVADSMSSRNCPYHSTADVREIAVRAPEHGFLGIRYVFHDGVAQIDSVLPGTPAEAIALQPGDHVISINGDRVDSAGELQERIFGSHPGARPVLLIERNGEQQTVRPTLMAWPAITY